MVSIAQQMDPAKQAKIMQEFQRQSAQMDMTVSFVLDFATISICRINSTKRYIMSLLYSMSSKPKLVLVLRTCIFMGWYL